MWAGVRCTFGVTSTHPSHLPHPLPTCDRANVLLFLSYVVVDMSCYCLGLYVIKRHGANLMVVAAGVALPLQQLVFCLRLFVTRKYAEAYYGTDAAALVLVLAGLLAYYRPARAGGCARGAARALGCRGGGDS